MNYGSESRLSSVASLVDEIPLRIPTGNRVITVQTGRKSKLTFLTEPAGLAVEQYKLLRRRLCTLHPDGGIVLITSPGPGEGKTLTSANLAWCLAELGERACLVDLDFRSPGISPILGYSFDEDGVDDVLSSKRSIAQSLRQVEASPLYVLGVRKRLISPSHLLSPAVLRPMLNELRAMFQWVIVDFAPIIPMSDVAEVVPQVDGALLIIRAGKTNQALVVPSLETLGAKLWGVVVNDSPIIGSSYYGCYGNR